MNALISVCNRLRWHALAVLALLTFGSVGVAQAHAAGPANFFRVTYSYSSTYAMSQEAQQYSVLVMQSTNYAMAAKLKAANPSLKILMYMDPLDSVTTDPNAYTACTSYNSDMASHPSWFLKDQNGNYIHPNSSSSKYAMDVGNPSYQQACVAHGVALAKQNGFDGIFFDDIETSYRWVFPSGIYSPLYPNPTAYYNSFVSFVSYAGPQIRSQGLISVGNLSAASPAQWQALTSPLDGSEEESWTDGGLGLAQQIPFMASKLSNVAWSEANGKLALLHSYNTTETGNTYGLASMLLVGNGKATYATSNSCYTNCESWYPEYDTAAQLGSPVGTYMKLPNGVYIRWFQNGVVLVNATANATASFSLGGGTYTGTGLSSVSSVSMPATSAYILLADPGNVVAGPALTSAPSISGNVWKGQTLTATAGSWSGSPAPTYQYQWSRCTTSSASSCTPISGANAASYVVQSADVGQYLTVAVTATNSGGVAGASAPLTIPVPAPTFTLTASPASQSVVPGYTVYYTIYVHPMYGWVGPVTFSATGAPPYGSATFSTLSSRTATTLHVTAGKSSPAGTYTVTTKATANGQSASVPVSVTVK
ncbi:MAG TPA: putative glycoside hydrolase [Solirubrobacteraceae bacterium]|nr:putative glycoside hydrolase [Solirubrobacteraceae bacterium]